MARQLRHNVEVFLKFMEITQCPAWSQIERVVGNERGCDEKVIVHHLDDLRMRHDVLRDDVSAREYSSGFSCIKT